MTDMKHLLPALITILTFGCSAPTPSTPQSAVVSGPEQFSRELQELKVYFRIPGMAVIIKQGDQTLYEDYLGLADRDQNIPVDSTITFSMASLTKIFASILVWQLVDEGKVSLEQPVVNFLEGDEVADSVKIKHLLSHTSQGELGQNFYYNNPRFMMLGRVIETASGESFKSNIDRRIIEPLGLDHTFLLEDADQVARENRKIAAPYVLDDDMKVSEGFIDYGYSAAAGITSTVRDLAKLSRALDKGELMNKSSLEKMYAPIQPGLPYGLGIFSQEIMGEKLVWGYGQYDCYSSLLLKVPDKDLVFVIAANNNLMSDPARLIAGDVGYSLFALSFLKNFVFNLDIPLLEDHHSLASVANQVDNTNREFYLKKLIGQAVAASFMARFDDDEIKLSKAILRQVFDLYPDPVSYGDLVLLHNLNMLKVIDGFRGRGQFSEFDDQFLSVGRSLLNIDQYNPYANYYMANFYDRKDMIDSTAYHFNQIVDARNFTPWWYTAEAKQWLEERAEE